MALRLVQAGYGNPRPLVLAFLVGGDLDPKLRVSFGPRCCIIADGSAKGPMLTGLLEFAHRQAGLVEVSRVALIGYSAGCQRVRALRLAGLKAHAYLLADGTHASWPPEEWQIAWLRELAGEARAGKVLLVASHTMQTYMEGAPKGRAFSSTVRVLRMATGWKLDRAGPLERPVVTRKGALWLYSYVSAKADAPAHAAQLGRVVPELVARHLGPWMAASQEPERVASTQSDCSGSSVPVILGLVLSVLLSTSRT